MCACGTITVLPTLRLHIKLVDAIMSLEVFSFIAAETYLVLCLLIKPARRELLDTIDLLTLLMHRKLPPK